MDVFGFQTELVNLLEDLSEEELVSFAQLHEDPVDDTHVELYILTQFLLFTKTSSTGYLETAVQQAEGWAAVTDADNHDHDRRSQLFDMMSSRMLAHTEKVGRSLITVRQRDLNGRASSIREATISVGTVQQWQHVLRLWQLCQRTDNEEDVLHAVQATRNLRGALIPPFGALAGMLNNTGIWLLERFNRTGLISDLDCAVDISTMAVDAASQSDDSEATCLGNLGNCLGKRFEHTESRDDLDRAINVHEKAVNTTPYGDPNRAIWLGTLGTWLSKRYECTASAEDLDRAVEVVRAAVEATSPEPRPPYRSSWLDNLALCLGRRYQRTRLMTDLTGAIELTEEVMTTEPQDSCDQLQRQTNLGIWLSEKFEQSASNEDIERAIHLFEKTIQAGCQDGSAHAACMTSINTYLDGRLEQAQANTNPDHVIDLLRLLIKTIPDRHFDRAKRLSGFANIIYNRFLKSEAMEDLEECIQLTRKAMDVNQDGFAYRALLENLGARLHLRYSITRTMSYLEGSIQASRQALDALSEGDPDQAYMLITLGNRVRDRYLETKALSDLDESIQVIQQALEATPEGHTDRIMILQHLDRGLDERSLNTRETVDLETSIRVARELVEATPETDSAWLAVLMRLGNRLRNLYSVRGDPADLEEALCVARQAFDSTPHGHPERAATLTNLGNALGNRFTVTASKTDIQEAIQRSREALNATSEDNPDRAASLANLGFRLLSRYQHTGTIMDLEESIQVIREAVRATSEDQPHWARWLTALGNCLQYRYSRLGAMADLEESIILSRQGVDATSVDHPDRFIWTANLSGFLKEKYSRTGMIADLEESIQMARKALEAAPNDHPVRATIKANLGTLLGNKYVKTRAIADINEAIDVTQQALVMTRRGHPVRATMLSNLGNRLTDRFSITGEVADLEAAITAARQGLDESTEDNNPEQAKWLSSLGHKLEMQYIRTGDVANVKEALSCFQTALMNESAFTIVRIEAGIDLLRSLAFFSEWDLACEFATLAVNLAPQLTSRSLENSDKQHILGQVAGLACDAAAAALHAEKTPLAVLTLLEQGRGVLAASLDEIRADILDLQASHPELAKRFVALRDELQTRGTQNIPLGSEVPIPSLKAHTDRRYTLGRDLDRLIVEIRERPDFQDFLHPPDQSEIQVAAKDGPIAMINVSKYRCDAILVERHQIRSLPLPDLLYNEIKEKALHGNLGSSKILEWLWETVASPILDALEFTAACSDDNWPHVWWIPTGLLSKFPLHAAGIHTEGSTCTVLDRVMSSYSSSIKSIVNGRRRRHTSGSQPKPSRALLVTMQNTPGQDRLHFATEETEIVRKICESLVFCPVPLQPHKHDITSELPNCNIFHFAGHGHTNHEDPLKSSLLLQDWESKPLTVGDLLEMDLRERAPFLAFLSACGTGEIKDQRFFDESIHLVSACQLAGFRHVIGTLWEVNDESCVRMAEIAYKVIMQGNMTDSAVCLGAHKAVRELRNQWLCTSSKGKRKSKLVRKAELNDVAREISVSTERHDNRLPRKVVAYDSEEENDEPLHWVPYVHFGV